MWRRGRCTICAGRSPPRSASLARTTRSTIDAVLNHRQSGSRSGVFGVYNRSTRLPAQAEALERWGRLIEDALEGRFPEEAEVIPLARRAQP